MWYYGKSLRYVSSYASSKNCHAIFRDISGKTGWLRVKPTSTDGVTNVISILTSALANGRKVNVQITSNVITGAYMS